VVMRIMSRMKYQRKSLRDCQILQDHQILPNRPVLHLQKIGGEREEDQRLERSSSKILKALKENRVMVLKPGG